MFSASAMSMGSKGSSSSSVCCDSKGAVGTAGDLAIGAGRAGPKCLDTGVAPSSTRRSAPEPLAQQRPNSHGGQEAIRPNVSASVDNGGPSIPQRSRGPAGEERRACRRRQSINLRCDPSTQAKKKAWPGREGRPRAAIPGGGQVNPGAGSPKPAAAGTHQHSGTVDGSGETVSNSGFLFTEDSLPEDPSAFCMSSPAPQQSASGKLTSISFSFEA